jgi:SAM-dependent methyltransferase
MEGNMSGPRRLYDFVYGAICGSPPSMRPWHFQWLATKDLYRELRELAPAVEGRLLDVGCGNKPYLSWFSRVTAYVGLDVTTDSDADVIVKPGESWPFEDASFDVVISTQVLEHVEDFENVRAEIGRVLRPGGQVVISVPFIYNEHGSPGDFRRFSVYGASKLFPTDWQVLRVARLGGFGSALGVLLLNWIDISLSRSWPTKLVKAILLPVWVLFSGVINVVGSAFDSFGDTSAMYVNVLAIFAKPQGSASR